MVKENLNMKLRARILLIISISSLILYLSVEGLSILPSIAQPDSRFHAINHSQKDKHSTRLDNEPKEASTPVPSPTTSPTPSPTPSSTSLWSGIGEVIGEAKKTLAPVTSSILNEAEAISSSIFGRNAKASSPDLAPFSGPSPALPPFLEPGRGLAPSQSPFLGPGLGPGSSQSPFLGPVPYASPPSSAPSSGLGPSSSPFSGPTPYSSPSPSPVGFFDHDVALALEARIRQSQSDAQLAMDEAKRLLDDPTIASSETGMCLSKCVDKYGASLYELNRAITDLGVRDVTLLADDFGAVEVDISACQACFTEKIGEDSPLKALEEATMKASRECLTVMDYAA